MAGGTTGDSGVKRRARGPTPWSVRGVSQEARAKTAKAAHRRGETMGEWVTNALIRAADAELGSGPRPLERNGRQPPAPPPSIETKPAVSTSTGGVESDALLGALERRLARLRRSGLALANDRMSEPELEAMARALLELARRGERSARHERVVRSLLEVLIACVERDQRPMASIDSRSTPVSQAEPQEAGRADPNARDAGGGRGERDAPGAEPSALVREAPAERDPVPRPAALADPDPFRFAYDRLHRRAVENTERRIEEARRRRGLGFLGLRSRPD